MKTCSIIISHYESLPFLRTCVRQIKKYAHPEINQKIIIADQSNRETNQKVALEFLGYSDVSVATMSPLYSGYGIDYLMQIWKGELGEYTCQLHVDAFPIHPNWLYTCIKLIEENNFSFVGQNHFISKPTDTIYPPVKAFFSMSPTFNVSKTETYKEMSKEAGFTRFHERKKIEVPIKFNNKDWDVWAADDYYLRGSDDDTVAFAWEGNHRQTNKLGLAVTGTMGNPSIESGYGRIIDDLVFHFGFCRESIGIGEGMGRGYADWTKKINENYNEELINEMLAVAHKNVTVLKPSCLVWDGSKCALKENKEIDKIINKFKNYDIEFEKFDQEVNNYNLGTKGEFFMNDPYGSNGNTIEERRKSFEKFKNKHKS